MIIENQWIGRDVLFNKDIEYKLDLFENCLLSSESLFEGYLDISLIESRFSSYNMVKHVFKTKEYELLNDINDSKLSTKFKDLYFLGKICYLAKKYIAESKFNHPITVYFNPRIEKNIAHPGIGRLEVHKLLGANAVKCLYFNTGGVDMESIGIRNFKKITLRQLVEEAPPFLLVYSLDHGSLIPQIHFVDDEKDQRYSTVKDLTSQIKNLKIKTNLEIDFLEEFVDDANYTAELIFSKSFTELDIARSIIFSLIGHDYQSENLTVTIKKNG
jgi:hypothetical protein